MQPMLGHRINVSPDENKSDMSRYQEEIYHFMMMKMKNMMMKMMKMVKMLMMKVMMKMMKMLMMKVMSCIWVTCSPRRR